MLVNKVFNFVPYDSVAFKPVRPHTRRSSYKLRPIDLEERCLASKASHAEARTRALDLATGEGLATDKDGTPLDPWEGVAGIAATHEDRRPTMVCQNDLGWICSDATKGALPSRHMYAECPDESWINITEATRQGFQWQQYEHVWIEKPPYPWTDLAIAASEFQYRGGTISTRTHESLGTTDSATVTNMTVACTKEDKPPAAASAMSSGCSVPNIGVDRGIRMRI
jgi:hypothetical protein